MVASVSIGGRTVRGTFLERPNRFLAMVRVGEEVLSCFLPSPGRMRELFCSGDRSDS